MQIVKKYPCHPLKCHVYEIVYFSHVAVKEWQNKLFLSLLCSAVCGAQTKPEIRENYI